ncbi:MAG: peptide deformylase [Candidatus Bipolaricaulia bacterium]
MSRPILEYPAPELRGRAEEIENIDGRIKELSEQLIETLARAGGVGLAAPQIGENVRLILIDIGEDFHLLINPEVVEVDDEQEALPEGCLSLPGIEAEVKRPKRVLIRGYTLEEKEIELEREDLIARALLHEIDHLDGVLFIDHLGAAKRRMLLKEYERLRREGKRERSAVPGL